jgi:hypothetical protein
MRTPLTVKPGSIMRFARACGDGNPAFAVTSPQGIRAFDGSAVIRQAEENHEH